MKEAELNAMMSVVADPIENVYRIDSQKDIDEIPELKEGKVDFEAQIEVSKYQREIVSKVMQSYQKGDLRNAATPPKTDKKKRNGWWQKLLKKPQSKLPED